MLQHSTGEVLINGFKVIFKSMTNQEYLNNKKAIDLKHQEELKELRRKYALANNPHKIDDVVTDHIGSLIIKQIGVTVGLGSDYPSCFYLGIEVKKDGKTAFKKQTGRKVYQSNLSK